MTDQNGSPRTIQSVTKACQIVEVLRGSGGATVSQLADEVGLSPGTTHTHLATLKKCGIVVQEGRTYDLGPQLLTLGEYVRNHSELYRASKKQVEKLARESGESCHLTREYEGQLIALYEQFGENAVGIKHHDRKREEPITHLHCTAAGKTILARMPEPKTREILDSTGLPQVTPHTITDIDELLAELEVIRKQGYAVADEEQIQGIRAVAAPVMGPRGNVKGSIAIAGPTSRLKGKRIRKELSEAVVEAANICQVNVQAIQLDGKSV